MTIKPIKADDESTWLGWDRKYWDVRLGASNRLDVGLDVIRSEHPGKLLGINAAWNTTQDDMVTPRELLWNPTTQQWRGNVGSFLNALGACTIRWGWDDFDLVGSVGGSRPVRASSPWHPPQQILYGWDEYRASFAYANPWLIFNRTGIGASLPITEFTPAELLAYTEQVLSVISGDILESAEFGNEPYHLLTPTYTRDRFMESCAAIKAARPLMRLFANIPPYNATYGTLEEWTKKMAEIPALDGLSVHLYGDGVRSTAIKVPLFLSRMAEMRQHWKTVRGAGAEPRFALTEYNMSGDISTNDAASREIRQGFAGAVFAGDVLLAVAQFPQFDAAHMFIGSGPGLAYSLCWDVNNPSAPYWTLRTVQHAMDDLTLGTITTSENASGYGYDIRGSAWCNREVTALGIAVTNRSSIEKTVTVKFLPFAGKTKGFVRKGLYSSHYYEAYTSTSISVGSADNSFNKVGHFSKFVVGDVVKTANFVNGANNGTFTVLTQSADKITVSGGTLVDELDTAAPSSIVSAVIPVTLEFDDVLGQTYYATAAQSTGSLSFDAAGEASLTVPANSVMAWRIE